MSFSGYVLNEEGVELTMQWTVMFTRALTTPDKEQDVQFDFLSSDNLYYFSIAFMADTDTDANAIFLFGAEIPSGCPPGECALAVPFVP